MPRTTRAATKAGQSILQDPDVDVNASKEALQPNEGDLNRPRLRSISLTSVGSVDNERPPEHDIDMGKGQGKKRGGRKKKADVAKEKAIQQWGLTDGVIQDSGNQEAVPVGTAEKETAQAEREENSETPKKIGLIAGERIADKIIDLSEAPASEANEAPKSALARSERSTRSGRKKQAKKEREHATESPQDMPSIHRPERENIRLELAIPDVYPCFKDTANATLIPGQVQHGDEQAQDGAEHTRDGAQEHQNEPQQDGDGTKDAQDRVEESQYELHQAGGGEQDAQNGAQQAQHGTDQMELPVHGMLDAKLLNTVVSGTPSRKDTPQIEDPIDAIDALEDQLEEIKKNIPDLDSIDSPIKEERSTPKAPRPKLQDVKKTNKVISQSPAKAPPRQSTVNRLAKTTQPSATSRIKALAEPRKSISTLGRSQSTKVRPTPRAAPKPEGSGAGQIKGKPDDYLASKRRPVSLSFPTPPPPPKSKKAPTVSTFTLPGEAIAAKLKAERLEREMRKREEEASKKREFKARPVPSTIIKPAEVRQTAASRARLSMMAGGGKENGTVTKRASVIAPAIQRDSSATSKRLSVFGAPNATAAAKRNSVMSIQTRPSSTLVLPKQRSSAAGANSSQPASRTTSTSTQKGKEVFNRGRVDEEARLQAQREKDEAVKRARAEAAERGRKASREWAEKQRREREKKAREAKGVGPRSDAGFAEMETHASRSEETASGAVVADEV